MNFSSDAPIGNNGFSQTMQNKNTDIKALNPTGIHLTTNHCLIDVMLFNVDLEAA